MLLPCPFCGAVEPQIEVVKEYMVKDSWTDDGHNRFYVGCGPCATSTARHKNEANAIAQWNTRVAQVNVPDDIRGAGWTVAVHNDYRLNGVPHTFWLFTKNNRCLIGEGISDVEALNKVREQIRMLGTY